MITSTLYSMLRLYFNCLNLFPTTRGELHGLFFLALIDARILSKGGFGQVRGWTLHPPPRHFFSESAEKGCILGHLWLLPFGPLSLILKGWNCPHVRGGISPPARIYKASRLRTVGMGLPRTVLAHSLDQRPMVLRKLMYSSWQVNLSWVGDFSYIHEYNI